MNTTFLKVLKNHLPLFIFTINKYKPIVVDNNEQCWAVP